MKNDLTLFSQITGLGIDIVDLTRTEFQTPNFAIRYMTKIEYQQLQKLHPSSQLNYMTGIWALKEAIIKATNHKFVFSAIEIKFTNEAPICVLPGYKLFLSLSYEKKIATAIAIATKTNVNEY